MKMSTLASIRISWKPRALERIDLLRSERFTPLFVFFFPVERLAERVIAHVAPPSKRPGIFSQNPCDQLPKHLFKCVPDTHSDHFFFLVYE
ncbi:hypothetical protein EBZ80_06640 [bacterium]|nr:hypothetical protein [bacterium]